MCIVVCDALKGLPEVITTVLLRNTFRSWGTVRVRAGQSLSMVTVFPVAADSSAAFARTGAGTPSLKLGEHGVPVRMEWAKALSLALYAWAYRSRKNGR